MSGGWVWGAWCRKATTIPATVTYECDTGYTRSGSQCHKTTKRAATFTTTYQCDTGYTRDGTDCKKTLTRPVRVVTKYVCPTDYNRNGRTCTKTTTEAATQEVTYVCREDYTRNGSNCERKVTTAVTVTKSTSCPGGYDPRDDGVGCERTYIDGVSRTREPYCDTGTPFTETDSNGNTRHKCNVAHTVPATEIPGKYRCPATPRGEPRYELKHVIPNQQKPICERVLIEPLNIVEKPYCPKGYKLQEIATHNTKLLRCYLKDDG